VPPTGPTSSLLRTNLRILHSEKTAGKRNGKLTRQERIDRTKERIIARRRREKIKTAALEKKGITNAKQAREARAKVKKANLKRAAEIAESLPREKAARTKLAKVKAEDQGRIAQAKEFRSRADRGTLSDEDVKKRTDYIKRKYNMGKRR